MERFAKRKIKIFDYLNNYRVFYLEDNGNKYYIGDYNTKNLDFIANDIKNVWMREMKRISEFYLVEVTEFLHTPVVDRKGNIKKFLTKEDCYDFIFKHSYSGMSFKYEIREVSNVTDAGI